MTPPLRDATISRTSVRPWPLAEGNPAADSQADLDGEGDSPDVPGFPWWMLVAGGVVALAAGYV